MSWIENIRQKPDHEKIKIIWLICGVAIAILILAWILIGGIKRTTQKDLRFFDSLKTSANGLGQSFKDLPHRK